MDRAQWKGKGDDGEFGRVGLQLCYVGGIVVSFIDCEAKSAYFTAQKTPTSSSNPCRCIQSCETRYFAPRSFGHLPIPTNLLWLATIRQTARSWSRCSPARNSPHDAASTWVRRAVRYFRYWLASPLHAVEIHRLGEDGPERPTMTTTARSRRLGASGRE